MVSLSSLFSYSIFTRTLSQMDTLVLTSKLAHSHSKLSKLLFRFFVLSGFLMCMLLIRAKEEAWFSLVTVFYTKRFNRILPLYFAIILLSMISLYNCFPPTAVDLNIDSASQALIFMSNRAENDAEDYFEMVTCS